MAKTARGLCDDIEGDNKIDSKRGIVYDREIAGKLSIEERSFLLKDHRQITEAYLKYI